jgi:hypothetical protein
MEDKQNTKSMIWAYGFGSIVGAIVVSALSIVLSGDSPITIRIPGRKEIFHKVEGDE